MKVINILNPQKWIGQIAVLAVFFLGGVIVGIRSVDIPATTAINIDQKAKKGATVSNGLGLNTPCNCDDYIKGLSMKEIKTIRKY